MKADIYSLYLGSPRLKPATSFLLFMFLVSIICFYLFPTALAIFKAAFFSSAAEIPLYLYAFYASAKLSAAYCLAIICQAACFDHEKFGAPRRFPSKKVMGLSCPFSAEAFKPPLNCGGALPLRGFESCLMRTGKNFAAGFFVYFLFFPFCFSLLLFILQIGCDGFDYSTIPLNPTTKAVNSERVGDLFLSALPNIADLSSALYWASIALAFFLGLFFYLAVLAFLYGKQPSYFIIRPIQKYIWNMKSDCGDGAIKPLPGCGGGGNR